MVLLRIFRGSECSRCGTFFGWRGEVGVASGQWGYCGFSGGCAWLMWLVRLKKVCYSVERCRPFLLAHQQRLKDLIDYPIGTPVGSYKVT